MKTKRENNYDLLRLLCTVAVICAHVSSNYIGVISNGLTYEENYLNNLSVTCIYNTLSRFSVPCFVMLSGAFLLSDERNADYGYFYKKSFKSIGIPTLIFSLLYFFYSFALVVSDIIEKKVPISTIWVPIKLLFKGQPFYHMWYLYMLIGVYILIPLIIKFKKDIGEKKFEMVSWIFLIISCISAWTSVHNIQWDISLSFCYLGYLMIGYVIRHKHVYKKGNFKGLCLILIGIIIETLTSYIRYERALSGIKDEDLAYGILHPYCPLILLASIAIFIGFSQLNVRINLGILSNLTFYVYLFHAGVLDLGIKIISKTYAIQASGNLIIPIGSLLTFLVSTALSAIFLKVYNTCKYRIRN